MKDGSPVWFGCDVGKDSSRDEGLLDTNTYQTDKLLGVTEQVIPLDPTAQA